MSMLNKLKQFKDLRDTAKTLKNSLASEVVEGSGGWGKIKIQLDGNQEIKSINIDPDYLNPDKKQKLESDLKDAFHDAVKKVQKVMAEKMKENNFDLSKFGL